YPARPQRVKTGGGTHRTSWGRSPIQWILVNGKTPPVLPTSEGLILNFEDLSDARTPLGDFFNILLAGQFAVANPVRLIGFLAPSLLPIRFVFAVVPFEPEHFTVAFERHHVGRDPVQKPAVETADDGAAGEAFQSFFECAQGVDVEIVGRLVEDNE